VPFHTLILCRKGIGKIQKLGADSGMSVRNCTIAGIHVRLENGKVVESVKVVGGSGHGFSGVNWSQYKGSAADHLSGSGQCLTRHMANGSQWFP